MVPYSPIIGELPGEERLRDGVLLGHMGHL